MTDYGWVLARTNPKDGWRVGETYDSLEWNSDTPKPSKKELDDAQPVLLAKEAQDATAKKVARQAIFDRLGLTKAEAKELFG